MAPLDRDPREDLEADLQPGERVVWTGRPDPRRWLAPSDVLMIPFSLLFGGFAILWEALAFIATQDASNASASPWFFRLWGLPFVTVGLYLMFGRFIVRRRLGRRTTYAITNLRAIAQRPAWRGARRTTSVWLSSAPAVVSHLARDGRGTIVIGSAPPTRMSWAAGDPAWPSSASLGDSAVAFWNIAEAREVSGIATGLISRAAA